jgi:hypothetical protein
MIQQITEMSPRGKLVNELRIFLAGCAKRLPAYAKLVVQLGVAESKLRSNVTHLRARYQAQRCALRCAELWTPKQRWMMSCSVS